MKILVDDKEVQADDPSLWEGERMEIQSGLFYMAQGLRGVIYEPVTRAYGLSNRRIEIQR